MMRNRLMSLGHLGISAATCAAATLSLLNVAGANPGADRRDDDRPDGRADSRGEDSVDRSEGWGRRLSGLGRADVHVAVDRAGELYLFSKTDGMIRAVIGNAIIPETR